MNYSNYSKLNALYPIALVMVFFAPSIASPITAANTSTRKITASIMLRIRTTVKQDGFEGILFPENRSKEKAVIIMSGSNRGMRITRRGAGFYERNGIPALALALFGTKESRKIWTASR